jgi:hypothetical protein
MIYLIIYLVLCLLWAIYAVWLVIKFHKANFFKCVINFYVNFIIFPISLFVAIKNKKFHWQGNLGSCKINK